MGREKQMVGRTGEAVARSFLTRKGYRIMAANVRTPLGELDLVARHNGSIVFVEVKARATASLGPPFLNMTPRKVRHVVMSALCYLKKYGLLRSRWRIDVVSVKLSVTGAAERIDHFVNAVEDNDRRYT